MELLLPLIALLLVTTTVVSSPSPSSSLVTAAAAAPAPSATNTTPTNTTAAPPTPAPVTNLTAILAKKSCKTFANLISAIPDVLNTFTSDIDGGLTIFCPTDRSLAAFLPTYKNLSAYAKASLLLYHGVPIYNSLDMLKTGNGEFNTLATDGTSRNFNFTVQNAGEALTIKTGIATATIVSTVIDKQPLAIYAVDEVLKPRELFKAVEAPAPAPAPASKEDKGAPPPEPDSPQAAPADQKAADEASFGNVEVPGWRWVVAATTASVVVSWSVRIYV